MTQSVPPADALHARLVFGTAEDVRAVADEHGAEPFLAPCAALNGGTFATNLMMMGTDQSAKLEMIRAAVNHPRVGARVLTALDANGNTFAHAVAMVPNASRELVFSCLEYAEAAAGVDALTVRRPEDGKTIVHIAARTPSLHTLSFIQQHPRLGKPAFVRATMADGFTAPTLAAMGDAPAALAKLAEMGGAVWARTVADRHGCNVGHFAASFGAQKVLEFLARDLNFGVDVFRTPLPENSDYDPDTGRAFACHMAAHNGRIDSAKTLLRLLGPEHLMSTTPDTHCNVAHFAATGDEAEMISWLLNHPQLRDVVKRSNNMGIAPFHLAAKAGALKVLRRCVKGLGAEVVRRRTPGQLGMSIAHFAACSGSTEVLQYILSAQGLGRDVLLEKDGQGMTIAASAALNGRLPTLQWIVKTLGDALAKSEDGEGRTAAHAAALSSDDILKFFAGHPEFGEAFLRQRDHEGNTIAHMAASEGRVKTLRYLESALGADFVRSPNNARVTPERAGAAYRAVRDFYTPQQQPQYTRTHEERARLAMSYALHERNPAYAIAEMVASRMPKRRKTKAQKQAEARALSPTTGASSNTAAAPAGSPAMGVGALPCGAAIPAPALQVPKEAGASWVDEVPDA